MKNRLKSTGICLGVAVKSRGQAQRLGEKQGSDLGAIVNSSDVPQVQSDAPWAPWVCRVPQCADESAGVPCPCADVSAGLTSRCAGVPTAGVTSLKRQWIADMLGYTNAI